MASTSASTSDGRVKSRAYARKAAAEVLESAREGMEEWCALEETRVIDLQAARVAVANAAPSSRFKALVDYLQAVRSITRRPAMLQEQINLIPTNDDFVNTMIAIVLNPLTVNLKQHRRAAVAISEDEMEVEGRAEFYVRQLDFSDKQALSTFLDGILEAKSQYAYLVARIKAEMKILPENGRLSLGYGGYTVASTAEERVDEDRDDAEESFIKKIIEQYDGPVRVFSFPALEFNVAGSIASRDDPRTSLFESLVIDAFGLVCANTASPGQYIQFTLTPHQKARLEMVRSYVPDPKLFEGFNDLNIGKPNKASSSKAAGVGSSSSSSGGGDVPKAETAIEKKPKKKAMAEKDKNATSSKGKGKGKQQNESPPRKRVLEPIAPLSPSKRQKGL
ncbi:hypothetical protein P389DRAFT_197121 [Cystobasidium minutum MCA 4210]|uniref:uncharacterized protein n=1 Tax=Cystobasidium minutum MCA 4210 TaxID=1397322 RepID=UPI0034CF8544|eukprot:jgi/Rhomi1/197121/gm1.5335_g